MKDFMKLLSQINTIQTATTDIALPPMKKVIFYNDDVTTMDFVVDILVKIFNKSEVTAKKLMLEIHTTGSTVVGEYTYDIAVSRKNLATQVAQQNGFPLRIEIE